MSARYTYDADNRLILSQSSKTGETKYRYDNAGNMTRKTTRDAQHFYTYNAENRMTGYKKRHFTGGSWRETIAAYKYSAEGNRIEKKVDGQIRRYIYDGIHIMYTMSQSGGVLSRFVYGNKTDERLARIKPSTLSTVEYYHTDAQGSTTELSDEVGNRRSRYRYTAFGETRIKQAGDSDNQFLYAGRQYDGESGLYYNRFRMYDAGAGRFTGRDANPGNPERPNSMHGYFYGSNNPMMFTDPMGLEDFDEDDRYYTDDSDFAYDNETYQGKTVEYNPFLVPHSTGGTNTISTGTSSNTVKPVDKNPIVEKKSVDKLVDKTPDNTGYDYEPIGGGRLDVFTMQTPEIKPIQSQRHQLNRISIDVAKIHNESKKITALTDAVNRQYQSLKESGSKKKNDSQRGQSILVTDDSSEIAAYKLALQRTKSSPDETDANDPKGSLSKTKRVVWDHSLKRKLKGDVGKKAGLTRKNVYEKLNFNRSFPSQTVSGRLGTGVVSGVALVTEFFNNVNPVIFWKYRAPKLRAEGAKKYPELVSVPDGQDQRLLSFITNRRQVEFDYSIGTSMWNFDQNKIAARTADFRQFIFTKITKTSRTSFVGLKEGDDANGTLSGWAKDLADCNFNTIVRSNVSFHLSRYISSSISNQEYYFSRWRTNSFEGLMYRNTPKFLRPFPMVSKENRMKRAVVLSLGFEPNVATNQNIYRWEKQWLK